MTDIKYKIRNKFTGQYIHTIILTGDVPSNIGDVSSNIGKVFDSYIDAYNFLHECQNLFFEVDRYLDISDYSIDEFHFILYNFRNVENNIENNIMDEPDNSDNVKKLRAILNHCVNNGFFCITKRFLDFILTYDKYQPILIEIVPNHILYSVGDFINVGIKTCDLDILGSISLTATTEQLKMHNIEQLFKDRS
ncbi:hypothetical protein [Yersinia phage fHe-Yen9-03]|uniref:Uncharacterized protein n=1 Tax=Yersinia phage fHe-Yen9-03 TaxID=2052743 RepID=A0A2C9CYR9_9CAUD|nr:hypothetical protein [Yersinia phage fHe-Yen9-03]